jgi:uncharacterized protein (DUF1330 family)
MSDGGVLVVVEVRSIGDADRFKKYQAGAREQIASYGGAVIARGGSPVEGDPPFGTLMIQKWPSQQAFMSWQESEQYRPLRDIRRSCADLRISVVPIV